MLWGLILAGLVVPQVHAWGAVGHEIVATIAQIFLYPSTEQKLREINPYGEGELYAVSTWADRIKGNPNFRWSGELHYTNPIGDHPPEACYFGSEGWRTGHDLLHAISNYTERLALYENVQDLSFLVHFVGDLHQPMHLTGRNRGGNSDMVKWEGRQMNLHSVWDSRIIAKEIRELHNYTRPTFNERMERHLRGTIYDPYIRFIVSEGISQWWLDDIQDWASCPDIEKAHGQTVFSSGPDIAACTESWARDIHKLTCSVAYPEDFDSNVHKSDFAGGYYRALKSEHTVERLLAQSGIRLAGILNSLFAEEY